MSIPLFKLYKIKFLWKFPFANDAILRTVFSKNESMINE